MNKNEFDESEHPRNKGGKFIKKNKGYDSRDNFGQTVSRAHKTYRQTPMNLTKMTRDNFHS